MTPHPSPRPPLPLRLLRSLAVLLLALAGTVIVALFYLSRVFSSGASLYGSSNQGLNGTIIAFGVLVALLPLALTIWAIRRRWLTWPVLVGGGLIAGAILGWLAWDDPVVRRPLSIAEIASAFDGADLSYAVIMEYGKLHPSEEAKAFIASRPKVQFSGASPRDAEKWIDFITKNRAGLEADWAAAAPQRAWLHRLDAFDRLGDLTPTDIAADIPRFDVWRFLSQRSCAIASLRAIDGHGDEAVATLLPMLRVSRKFETSARTLVRHMTARVAQRICYDTVALILDRADPGPIARAQLLAALDGGNGPAGARRVVLTEYAFLMPALEKLSLGDTIKAFDWSHPREIPLPIDSLKGVVFNPRATANLYGDYAYELAALAEKRDASGIAKLHQAFENSNYKNGGMKNLGGRLIINMAVPPTYKFIVKSYWETEDARLAVLARLKAPA